MDRPARPAIALTGAFGAASTPASVRAEATSKLRPSGFGSAEARPPEQEKLRVTAGGGFGDARLAEPAPRTPATPQAVTAPVEIIFKPRPEYTDEARTSRLEGEVVLEMRFSASGQAQVLRMVRGLGRGLDEAAQRAALAIQFRPALKAGTPVDSTALVHIVFQLAY